MAGETMILIPILRWITRKFKGLHSGDYIEVTQHSTEKNGSFITELKLSFRTEEFERGMTDTLRQKMRDELNEITDNSVKKLDFVESSAARYTNAGSSPQNERSALMIKIEVFYKEKI